MSSELRSLESLPRRASVELLSGAVLGRVVFTQAALPAVVPVTFAVLDGAIVLRTSVDTRLAGAADGGVLALEVDEFDPATRAGWSVVVTGIAKLVRDPVAQATIRTVVQPFVPGTNEVYVRLPLTVVTGRRIAGPAAPRAMTGTG